MENQRFVPGDPILIENIVSYLKAKGLFDEFRHECLADVDTKSSYQNMSKRVVGYTSNFLLENDWNPDMNKNELRNKLRKNIDGSGILAIGSDHVVEQVLSHGKIGQLLLPKIIEVVHQYLKEESEKLNKKHQSNENVSSSSESYDGSSVKTKTPVLDPIADILSFTYSKPKVVPASNVQKSEIVAKKGVDVSQKTDKKKEDVNQTVKSNEVLVKVEKKEEENVQPVKSIEASVKNDDTSQVNVLETSVKLEKMSEDVVKLEVVESVEEDEEIKPQIDLKEIKLKKDIKTEEVDSSGDSAKKLVKDDAKVEKKKTEDAKSNEGQNSSEDNKTSNTTSKSGSHSKPKHDSEKSKKLKIHSSKKSSCSASEQRKPKLKETSDTKLQSDKHSKNVLLKSSKPTKELSASAKSNSSKLLKKEKSEDEGTKVKTSDSQTSKSSNLSLKKSSSKPNSSKTEHISSKSKPSEKLEKEKQSKVQISKPKSVSLPSSSGDKGSKVVHQSSSSYDSSQSSDFDKGQQVTSEDEKKLKHFSKHSKREGSSEKSSTKDSNKSSSLKRSHKTTDQTSPKKHKKENSKISFKDKLKEDTLLLESTKSSSRSNSLSGSVSSTTSRDAYSDDASESSSRQSEKKKKPEKERCSASQDIPFPPPPPPPPSSDLVVSETTSSSPDDTTQESGTVSSDDESYSGEESSEEDSSGSEEDLDSRAQASDPNSRVEESADLSEIYDSFLYSSSSSDFEGFCSSPERNKGGSSDLSVSSVHTSDLSSYEDEISAEDLSSEDGPQSADQKSKKKLTLKEAQELLRSKEVQKSSDSVKDIPYEGTLMKEKSSEIALPTSISILSSEEENTPRLEPRRELRRERKLNPKYASNEYTSIFNSKRTSFITKQMNLSPPKPLSNTSQSNLSNSNELTVVKCKERAIISKTSATSKETSDASNNALPVTPEEKQNPQAEIKKRKFEAESMDDLSCNENNLESSSLIELSYNRKSQSIKTIENKISKDLNPNGVKRKFDGADKTENKRLCVRNSIDKDISKRDLTENKSFNNQNMKKSVLSNNNLHKQKANGDVLRKMDHLRKGSHSKPNCASDKSK